LIRWAMWSTDCSAPTTPTLMRTRRKPAPSYPHHIIRATGRRRSGSGQNLPRPAHFGADRDQPSRCRKAGQRCHRKSQGRRNQGPAGGGYHPENGGSDRLLHSVLDADWGFYRRGGRYDRWASPGREAGASLKSPAAAPVVLTRWAWAYRSSGRPALRGWPEPPQNTA
jgi:hypothetical protein